MQRADLLKLVGADGSAEYTPVAFLLRNGYACAGNFNSTLNQEMTETCILLNCRMVELSGEAPSGRGISDFNEFLEDVVTSGLAESESTDDEFEIHQARFGRPVPIVAVPLNEVAVVYPIAHIETLVKRASEKRDDQPRTSSSPNLLDFKRSEILAVLNTKLW